MDRQKILYISGCIGLGHVTRDLSIARELQGMNENVDIIWLADPPAYEYLKDKGEAVLSDMTRVSRGATDLCDAHADDYKFNLYPWWMEWYKTFPERSKIQNEVAQREKVDLIVGDETYDLFIDYLQHPKNKKIPFLLMLDFVGGHLNDGVPKKKLPLWFYNRWNYQYLKKSFGKEGTIFIGDDEDVVNESLGLLLPNRREVVKKYATSVGYSLNFDPSKIGSKDEVRKKLGLGPEPLVVVTIGGTAACAPLLTKAAEAYPIMKKSVPDLKMIIVAGPRVSPDCVKPADGLDLRGLVPDLYQHLAAADLVISAGGGTTTLELQALNKPFIYFPLEEHFEQQTDVAYHLGRDNVGVKMSYSQTSAQKLAEVALQNLGKAVKYPPLPLGGAKKAAQHIDGLLKKIKAGQLKASTWEG
ncbi:MAG TPA: glycosyltransferase [Methanomassiliicoccales archaeon]|nr:glycosyltransferase [Methanomassiliicoccales archaeon]